MISCLYLVNLSLVTMYLILLVNLNWDIMFFLIWLFRNMFFLYFLLFLVNFIHFVFRITQFILLIILTHHFWYIFAASMLNCMINLIIFYFINQFIIIIFDYLWTHLCFRCFILNFIFLILYTNGIFFIWYVHVF